MEHILALYILPVLLFTSSFARLTFKNDALSNVSEDKSNSTKLIPVIVSGITQGIVVLSHNFLNTTESNKSSISMYTTQENTTDIPLIENNVNGAQQISAEINNNSIDTNNSIPLKKKDGNDPDRRLILTTYIEEGRIEEGRKASEVNPDLFLGFKSYSGYFTVNKTYDSNIFFWYFPVENKSVNNTPWIIWLQGGPGVTSSNGLFDEIGPFSTNSIDKLKKNRHTWLRDHSLLFIDNPVGTGFSFTRDDNGYVSDMRTYADHLYSTLKQFLQIFPELRVAPLFVAGESYGGKYAPALAMEIHKHKHTPTGDINLQGVMVGNPLIEPTMIMDMTRAFYQFGILTQEQLDIAQPLIDLFKQAVSENDSVNAKKIWHNLLGLMLVMAQERHAYNFLVDNLKVGHFIPFLNQPEIRNALHVGNASTSFSNFEVNRRLAPDFLSSTRPMFEELLNEYRVLAYCGQLDQMLPCSVSAEHYRRWKWDQSDDFLNATRTGFYYKEKLAGYCKSGGRFTEVLVRGAGHMAPMDAPAPVQDMVTRWTNNQPMSVHPNMIRVEAFLEYVRKVGNQTVFV